MRCPLLGVLVCIEKNNFREGNLLQLCREWGLVYAHCGAVLVDKPRLSALHGEDLDIFQDIAGCPHHSFCYCKRTLKECSIGFYKGNAQTYKCCG